MNVLFKIFFITKVTESWSQLDLKNFLQLTFELWMSRPLTLHGSDFELANNFTVVILAYLDYSVRDIVCSLMFSGCSDLNASKLGATAKPVNLLPHLHWIVLVLLPFQSQQCPNCIWEDQRQECTVANGRRTRVSAWGSVCKFSFSLFWWSELQFFCISEKFCQQLLWSSFIDRLFIANLNDNLSSWNLWPDIRKLAHCFSLHAGLMDYIFQFTKSINILIYLFAELFAVI